MVVLSGEDKLALSRLSDLEQLCIKKKTPQFSHFQDPRELMLFEKSYRPSAFVTAKAFGGYNEAERQIIGFFPDFSEADFSDFPLSVLKITGAEDKGHRDFLGSILGLGIKRSAVGDIVTENGTAYVFCENTVCDFLLFNLTKIGRQRVQAKLISPFEACIPKREFDEFFGTAASLRLDALLSLGAKISRSKALALIESEAVNLNWQTVTNPAKTLCEGDVISARGYGRIRIGEIIGETKKGRIKILIRKDK